MIELDTSRAPRGVLAAQALIVAVAKQGDLAERHYLELKSTLDLSTKKDKEKIAKFILGASNRMPDVAAKAFEGYGVMVIGVKQGDIAGIPPIEMVEISKTIQQYVGAAGPRWDIVWVPIESSPNLVLLILVDPPEFGQGPFPCRANGESLTSGRIYIRADGETREANAEEFDLLLKRGSALPKAEVDFAVDLLGGVSSFSLDDDRTVQWYLRIRSGQLLAALPSKEPPTTTRLKGIGSGAAGFAAAYAPALESISSPIFDTMYAPEERTEDGYRAAVDRWEADFRRSWAAAKSTIAASQLTPITVKITNRTMTFLRDVELKLHLEGEVFAFDYVDPERLDDLLDIKLPHPPREWGPHARTVNMSVYADLAHTLSSSPVAYLPPSISFKNVGSVDLNLNVGELRPLGTYESEDEVFVLVVADETLTTIHGTWQLTARDHNEVYRGEISTPVAGVRDITEVARQILKLWDEEMAT